MSALIRSQRVIEPTATRLDLANAITDALDSGSGLAAAKAGVSEQALLAFPLFLERCTSPRERVAIRAMVTDHCVRQMGVFPSDERSLLRFADFHAHATAQIDILGLCRGRFEADIVDHYGILARPIANIDLEPDRSIPDNSADCYLPRLTGRRLLIISSMARLLRDRATPEVFEAVWAKTGKPWFAPASVSALEFPFVYDDATKRRFESSQALVESIISEIDPDSFDVALIAGSSIGIPIASAVKGMGRVAIALGGSLQVLFGVQGRRWRDRPDWQRDYVTDAWIDPPDHYRPVTAHGLPDEGAYW